MDVIKNKATICIVNYKTLDFTRLCLRSIRKFTNYPYEIIVVDNDSQDESLEYLKSLREIKLVQRKTDTDQSGGYSHSQGLDLGLENCNTEFFISMHSDTFVKKENWLCDLISYFSNNEKIASVGSGKIELTPAWQTWIKKAADYKTLKRILLQKPDPHGKYKYYNRTICSLYRTEILKNEGLNFTLEREHLTAGHKLYLELLNRGYQTVKLPPAVMQQYIVHLAHATQAINPDQFKLRKRTVNKCFKAIDKVMSSPTVQNILADTSLDK